MQDAPVRFPSVQWLFQCDDRLAACEALEVREFLQRAVETGRRDFQPLVVDVLDRQNVLQLTRDLLAILDRDARGLIDVHGQHPAPGAFEVDKLVTEPGHGGFNQFRQLHSAHSRCLRVEPAPHPAGRALVERALLAQIAMPTGDDHEPVNQKKMGETPIFF